jgi:hypothetical protein
VGITEIIGDLSTRLQPDSIVGRRYRFGTTWNNEPHYVEGIVTQFLWDIAGTLHYSASGKNESITVFGLIKQGKDWSLMVRSDQFVIYLAGTFEFI